MSELTAAELYNEKGMKWALWAMLLTCVGVAEGIIWWNGGLEQLMTGTDGFADEIALVLLASAVVGFAFFARSNFKASNRESQKG